MNTAIKMTLKIFAADNEAGSDIYAAAQKEIICHTGMTVITLRNMNVVSFLQKIHIIAAIMKATGIKMKRGRIIPSLKKQLYQPIECMNEDTNEIDEQVKIKKYVRPHVRYNISKAAIAFLIDFCIMLPP